MKTFPSQTLFLGLLSVIALSLSFALAGQAHAGSSVISSVAVDEFGHGTAINGGFSFAFASSMASDPGPGGQASALTYQLLFFGTFTAGDLFLTDPGSGTSDVIRFNLFGVPTLVFYSFAGEGALADTGLPSAAYANMLTIAENPLGPTSYTPTVGQPGYVPNNGTPVTYLLNSFRPQAVPESGGTFFLLAGAVLGLMLLRR